MRHRGGGFASLTAAAHASRARLKTGFFNKIRAIAVIHCERKIAVAALLGH
jgi:hypothetical protein